MAVIRNLVVKIGADISGLNRGLKMAQRKLQSISNSLAGAGRTLSLSLTMPIILLGKQALQTSAEFEQSMANASSVSGATAEELQRMTEIAREMGKTTVFSASQSADAMYYMASAGYKVEQMAQSIEPILNLASATQSELAFTTDTVIATLNQFGLQASDAGRVTNVFASIIGNSQATLDKLADSMRYVGPVANSLGYSIEETAGALGLLYNSGFKGEQAGTILRGALTKLLNPTAKMKNTLEELGLAYDDVNPSTKSLVEIVGALEKAGLSTAQAVAIFGQRAGPGMIALVGQGSTAIEAMTKTITDTNSASEMASKQLDTMQGSSKLLKSMLEEVAISIGDILIPVLRELAEDYLMPLTKNFQSLSKAQKELGVKISLLVASIGPLLIILSKMVRIVAFVIKIVGILSSPIAIVVVAVIALIAILVRLFKTNEQFKSKVLAVWNKVKDCILKSLNSIKAWWYKNGNKLFEISKEVFQGIAGVITSAIEIALRMIDIFVGGLTRLWNENKAFGDAIVAIWQNIRQEVSSAVAFIVAWWKVNGQKLIESTVSTFSLIWNIIINVLSQIIKSLTVFYENLIPVWDSVKKMFSSLWGAMQNLWEALEPLLTILGGAFLGLLGIVIGVFNGIIQALGPFIEAIINIVDIISDLINIVASLLKGDFKSAWESVISMSEHGMEMLLNIWQTILNFCGGFVDGISSFFSGMGVDIESITRSMAERVQGWFTNMLQGISNTSHSILDSVTGVFNDIEEYISGLIDDAYDWGRNLIQAIVDGINSAIDCLEDSVNEVGEKIKDFLGFSSPTKEGPGSEADKWMPNLMGMLAKGISRGLPDIQGAVSLTAGAMSGVAFPNMSSLPKDNSMLNGLLNIFGGVRQDNNDNTTPVELTIDGQVFARLIMPSLTKELKRNGINLEDK